MLRWPLEVNGGSCKIVSCNSACALIICIEPYLIQRSYPLHTVSSPESVKLFPIDYFVRTQCQLSVPVLISNIFTRDYDRTFHSRVCNPSNRLSDSRQNNIV